PFFAANGPCQRVDAVRRQRALRACEKLEVPRLGRNDTRKKVPPDRRLTLSGLQCPTSQVRYPRDTMTATDSFLKARDFLLAHRTDYATAYRDFAWPQVTEFNWALDWFDRLALNNDRPALWIVEEAGPEQKISFARMAARSNQVANWLRAQGVARGHRVLLM